MEHRIEITLMDCDEPTPLALLEAIERIRPDVGPVVAYNTSARTAEIVFSLEAEDARDAIDKSGRVFIAAIGASDVEEVTVTGYNAQLVPDHELDDAAVDEPELQPA